MKAIILKGIPASGKSTYAKTLVNAGFIRINRDTIRKENPTFSEDEVRHHKNLMITDAHVAGKDIVIDDTNINENTLAKTRGFLASLGYEVSVYDAFQELAISLSEDLSNGPDYRIALDTCLLRNERREDRVPESVLYEMFFQDNRALKKEKIFACDLDGTLYNITHRQHWVQNIDKKKNRWDKFESVEEITNDVVVEQVKEVLKAMKKAGYSIVLLSGRKNTMCEITVQNLERDGVEYDALLMRSSWDNRKDNEVKKDFLDLLKRKHEIFAVVDDRPQVIDMWRKEGIFVFNVGDGKIF